MYFFMDTAKLRDSMRKNMLSTDDMAKKSGLAKGTYHRIFSGRYARVQSISLQAMAEAVGVTADKLTASADELQIRKDVLERRIEKNDEPRKQIRRYERELKQLDAILNSSGY